MEYKSVNKLLEKSFRENWEREALSNYQGVTLKYKDVAERIELLHIAFEKCGLKKGDKVALCSRNQAHWGVCFMAATTSGAVPVPILHEFKPENIHYLVNHSDAKVFFVDEVIWQGLSEAEMPGLEVIVQMNTLNYIYARHQDLVSVRENLTKIGIITASATTQFLFSHWARDRNSANTLAECPLENENPCAAPSIRSAPLSSRR